MNSSALIGGFKKSLLQDLLSSLNAVISTNEITRFITGRVIYDPRLILPTSNLKLPKTSWSL